MQQSDDAFSGESIRKAVLRRSVVHPLTVLPTGLATVVAAGSLLGPAPLFLGAAVILASVGMGSFAVNYFFRSKTLADRYVRGLERRNEVARSKELQSLRRELEALGSAQGVKQYDELLVAHAKLHRVLHKREQEGVALDMRTMKEQADATLEEGLSHLRALASTTRALKAIDADKLRGEAEELEERIGRLRGPDHARSREALEGQLQAMRSRLHKHREAMVRTEEILAVSERCESALETSALDIGEMREVTARFVQDQSANLRATVEAARRFNESMGPQDDSADRIYDRPEPEGTQAEAPEAPRREREKE